MPMTPDAWSNGETRAFGLRRATSATRLPLSRGNANGSLDDATSSEAFDLELLLFNGAPDVIVFTLPQPAQHWQVVLESATLIQTERAIDAEQIEVAAHSLTVLSACSKEKQQ